MTAWDAILKGAIPAPGILCIPIGIGRGTCLGATTDAAATLPGTAFPDDT